MAVGNYNTIWHVATRIIRDVSVNEKFHIVLKHPFSSSMGMVRVSPYLYLLSKSTCLHTINKLLFISIHTFYKSHKSSKQTLKSFALTLFIIL